MLTPQQILLVRSLKGSLAQIALAFLFAQTALDLGEVRICTGLNQETAREGLAQLKGMGLMAMQRVAHNRVLWLPAGTLLPGFQISQIAENPRTDVGIGNQIAENPRTGNHVVAVDQYKFSSVNLINNNNNTPQIAENPRTGENLATFKELKIYGKKAAEVAALEWVTPDDIRAHVQAAKDMPDIHNWQGFALTQLANHVPAPDAAESSAQKDALKSTYTAGMFADDIQNDDPEEHNDACKCIHCKQQHPERFCQFQIVHEAKYLGGNTGYHQEWTSTCDRPLKPGQKYCDKHQERP